MSPGLANTLPKSSKSTPPMLSPIRGKRSSVLFNNTELRFPLIGDNIGGVLFEDFGNVFARPGDISFAFHQPHPDTPTDFNYMVHAAGFGIRYKTPIGPVRLDLAYSLNPPKYNGYAGSFQDLVNCTANNNC